MSLADVIHDTVDKLKGDPETEQDRDSAPGPSSSKKSPNNYPSPSLGNGETSPESRRRRAPATPTGIPTALNDAFLRHGDSGYDDKLDDEEEKPKEDEDEYDGREFAKAIYDFKGGLDANDPEQIKKQREAIERRSREQKRESLGRKLLSYVDLSDSPTDEHHGSGLGFMRTLSSSGSSQQNRDLGEGGSHSWKLLRSPSLPPSNVSSAKMARSRSHPPILTVMESEDGTMSNPSERGHNSAPGVDNTNSTENNEGSEITPAQRWARLRALLPRALTHSPTTPHPELHAAINPFSVNVADELLVGGLSTLMLKMWFERDEAGHRRVPVLFHRLRVRVSDSLHPTHNQKAVFRIECEYANGAARWVVYRQLRDFVTLHTHYRLSNAYNRNVDALPEFPKTSLPYFRFLAREKESEGQDHHDFTSLISRGKGKEGEGKEKGGLGMDRAEFAGLQRNAIEKYLISLIRAVMFHPTSNRLAKFLEISALSINLAQSGGSQAKAGMLRIHNVGFPGGGGGSWARKSVGWAEKRKMKWSAVRESYLVVVEDPGELTIWDVFLLDSEFRIERPKRYYRQGFNLLREKKSNMGEVIDVAQGHIEEEGEEHERHKAEEDGRDYDAEHSHSKEMIRSHSEHHLANIGRSLRGVKHALGKVFHLGHGAHPHQHHHHHHDNGHTSSDPGPSTAGGRGRSGSTSSSSSSSSASSDSRAGSPLLDPSTHLNAMAKPKKRELEEERQASGDNPDGDAEGDNPNRDVLEEDWKKEKKAQKKKEKDVSKHTFFLVNSQLRVKVSSKNERQMQQWITALERTAAASHWAGTNRFGSFAPIRLNVAAQWLVDGRDYFWNLSRAILLAKERIYIHDWWISPEVYLRRPGKENYRLDKLLKRKAEEGVKIYIIIYKEVSSRTTPVDSNYTKQMLTGLHPNIMVQRSPSHFQTGTFYWAHHEKLCVIDEAIAFMGGFDLCFGRWDTPQHVLIDDPDHADGPQIWPGKDYSNGRVTDFHTLNKPEEDMYDRTKVPRMPWHDVGMQVVGQPARDLCRHFIQRWNFLLRIKNHNRVMPFLIPPAEFSHRELVKHGLRGTCEMQICRSAGPWSMGTPMKIEHSIQNAYLKAIQLSDHFVYIENQFFITSTTVNDVKVENKIGDALVHRIIRAHREGTPWKACVVIPLLPGFPMPVDHSDASALRIILECQNRTISRGPNSIFGRLRKEGIDPDDYIVFFSLRGWGKLKGDVLTTEQVYIHGKVCIVDDRLAIIGSANINERSQRGDRDSELAAIIRDTDMIDSTMAGKPYKVGRFAHTLRIRLMREHLGVDVDSMYEEDLMSSEPKKEEFEQEAWDPNKEQRKQDEDGVTHITQGKQHTPKGILFDTFKDGASQALHGTFEAKDKDIGILARKAGIKPHGIDNTASEKALEDERTTFDREGNKVEGFASSQVPTLEEKTVAEHRPPQEQSNSKPDLPHSQSNGSHPSATNGTPPEATTEDGSGEKFGAPADASKDKATDDQFPHARSGVDDPDAQEKAAISARKLLRRHLSARLGQKQFSLPVPRPEIDPNGFGDPISEKFWDNVWVATAVHNTEVYRKVFHAVPDDLVTTWKQYKDFILHHERLSKPAKDATSKPEPVGRVPSEAGSENDPGARSNLETQADDEANPSRSKESLAAKKDEGSSPPTSSANHKSPDMHDSRNRKPTKADEPFEQWEKDEMEEFLADVRGHLVLYSNRFLEGEDVANNFLFNADRLLPMPIYD